MGGSKKKKSSKQKSGGGGPPIAGGLKITNVTSKKAKVAQSAKSNTAPQKPAKNSKVEQAIEAAADVQDENVKIETAEDAMAPQIMEAVSASVEEEEAEDYLVEETWEERGENYDPRLTTTATNENYTTKYEQDDAWDGSMNQREFHCNKEVDKNTFTTSINSLDETESEGKEYANKGAVQKEFQHGNHSRKQNWRDGWDQKKSSAYDRDSRQQQNYYQSGSSGGRHHNREGDSKWRSKPNADSSRYKGSSQDDCNESKGGRGYNPEGDSKRPSKPSSDRNKHHDSNTSRSEKDNDSNRQRKLSSMGRSPNRNIESGYKDEDFDEFWKYLKASKDKKYVKVREIEGDLFAMPKEYSLAHCVAEDMNMGSGIAVQFSQQFKRRDELYQQRQKQGGVAVLTDDDRFIYYLVTKKQSNGKPTIHTLWSSLKKMQKHIEENQVAKVAIPRIGCGLDRLEWSQVKAMVEYTFRNTDVEITVCNFQQSEDPQPTPPPKNTKCAVKNVPYPLVQIEQYTAIVYLGSEDRFMTEEIESLDTKFRILQDYKTSNKKVGEVIQSFRFQRDYALYGFIVTKSKDDPFNYLNFQKCVDNLKKLNSKKDFYEYVGIQAFLGDDELLMSKIVNILRHTLKGVDVYVCWPERMKALMPQERRDDYY